MLIGPFFFLIDRMSKKSSPKTFRLAFVRGRINRAVRSARLREVLLDELNGGQDASLIVRMVERVHPLPEARPTQEVRPTPIPAPPPCPVHGRVPPVPRPAQPQAPVPPPAPAADGSSRAAAVEVLDSDEEFIQELALTPRRERRLRAQIEAWKSSGSD